MINQRRIIGQRVDQKPLQIFHGPKPSSALPIPLISFNYQPTMQSRMDQSQKLSPRIPLQMANNTSSNRASPQYLRANHSTVVNCVTGGTRPNQSFQTKENSPVGLQKMHCKEGIIKAGNPNEHYSTNTELISLRLQNQRLREENRLYKERLAILDSKQTTKEKLKRNTNIPSVKSSEELEFQSIQSKEQPVSIPLISNKFMLREMPEMDDVQYYSEIEVEKLKSFKETSEAKQSLIEKESQIKKLEILIEKFKVNELLLIRKVEALEVLVAVLRLKNCPGDEEIPQLAQESQAEKKIQTLFEYKTMFDQLSRRVDSMVDNSRNQQEKIVDYERKMMKLQELLIKMHLEIERYNQIIPELDQSQPNQPE